MDVKVLVVEDTPEVVALIKPVLEAEGWSASVVGDGLEAVDLAEHLRPDVIVLDIGLPGLDGIEVCRRLRAFTDAYVVMMTARDDEIDKLIGLSVGADDYLTKPVSPRELVARIKAMLRRPRASNEPTRDEPLTHGPLRLDKAAREATRDGEPLDLTRIEFDLLTLLLGHPRMVFTRDVIREHVWGPEWFGSDHVIDVHVANLRKKIDRGDRSLVRTVRGVGYRLEEPGGA